MSDKRQIKAQLLKEADEFKKRVAQLELALAEHEQAGERLRRTEKRFREMAEASPAIIVEFELDMRVTYMNRAGLKAFGCDEADLEAGLTIPQHLIVEEDRKRLKGRLAQAAAGMIHGSAEYGLIKSDGARMEARITTTPIIENGKVVRLRGIVEDVTEKKRVEEALKKERRVLNNIIELNPYSIGVYDSKGRFVKGNQALEDLFGVLPSPGYSLFDDPILKREGVHEQMLALQKGQAVKVNTEAWYDPREASPDRPGRRVCVKRMAFPVLDQAGRPESIVIMHEDVTARRMAEAALKKSEEILLAVLDGVEADVYVADLKTYEILFVNKHMIDSFGPGLVGQACHQAFRGQARPCPHCTNAKLVDAAGEPSGVVIWEGQNPLTGRWYFNHDRAIRWVDGRLVRLQVAADITERKEAEAALKQSEATARALLNATPSAAAMVDAEGRLIMLNQTFAQRFEQEADDLIGKKLNELLAPHAMGHHDRWIKQVFRTGNPVYYQEEWAGKFFGHTIYPLFGSRGEVDRAAMFSRDVTRWKKAEDEVKAYQDKLRSLAAEISLAAARERRRIAVELHDRVGQNLALALMKLSNLEKVLDSAGAARDLEAVAEQIRLASSDVRSMTLQICPPALYQLGLGAALDELAEQIQKDHGLNIEFEDDEQPKPLRQDTAAVIYGAVRELMLNVVKHARAGWMKVGIHREGKKIRIMVVDDGIGFGGLEPEAFMAKVKSFGLFSIRERLKPLGARLKFESSPGQGTRAVLEVPLEDDEPGVTR